MEASSLYVFKMMRCSYRPECLHVYFPALTELSAVAEGESGDQHLSVSLLSARPPQQILPCCPAAAGPHRQQGPHL